MSDIQPASFADLKKAWDYWRHHQDLTNGVTPNARAHRLEFLRGMDQIKTQAKTDALRDAAERLRAGNLMIGPNYIDPSEAADWLEHRADQMEGNE